MTPRRFSVIAEHPDVEWEFDEAAVDERAKLLLKQLDQLSELPASKSVAVYKRPTIKFEASWLLDQCVEHGMCPPRSLAMLIQRLLDVDTYANEGPKDKNAWRRAIAFEARHPADPTGNRPSTASEIAIARHVWPESDPEQHRELRDWRRGERYRAKVAFFHPRLEG